MTDRELLEAAARAAGIRVPTKKDYPYKYIDERGLHLDISCGGDGSKMSHWNPLTDDGDAQCLAVKLRMTVRVEDYGTAARIGDDGSRWWGCEAHLYGGIEAATRRAIVRAAASMSEPPAEGGA